MRELENRIKGAVIMAEGAVVTAATWGSRTRARIRNTSTCASHGSAPKSQAVRQALAVAHGNLSRAAELLGVTRPTLYDLLGKHSIDAAQFGKNGPHAALAVETRTAPEAVASPTDNPGME